MNDNQQILSWKQLIILFLTGPLFFFSLTELSNHFPRLLSEGNAVGLVFTLQAVVAVFFMRTTDSNIDSQLNAMSSSSGRGIDISIIKIFTVFATTVGSMLLLVLPGYLIGNAFGLF